MFCLILLAFSLSAQDEANLSYKLPVNISAAAYRSPGFVYGIKAVSGEVKEFNYVMLRTYTVTARTEGISCQINPPVKIMVGFLGFSPSAVNSATELFTMPSDTSILPCVHNLLSDLMVKKRMQFDFKDLKKLKIAVYNLNTEKALYSTFQDKFLISPESSNLLFLIWDQYKEPGLPVAMQTCSPLIIDVTAPLKFKSLPKTDIAQAVSPAPPKENAKTISPAATTVAPAAVAVAKDASKTETAVNVKPETANPTKTAKPVEPETSNPKPTPEVAKEQKPIQVKPVPPGAEEQKPLPQKPGTSASGLIHEISVLADEYLLKNKIDKEKVQLTYSLNSRIDSLKIIAVSDKGEKNYIMLIPQYPPVPVKFSQPEDLRRKGEDDTELPDIIKMYSGKLKIRFYNQDLYFDSLTSCVLIPKAFSPVEKVHIEGLESAVSKFIIDDKGQPTSMNIQVKIPKTPLKLTVLDKRTSLPIKNLDIRIYYGKKKKCIYYGSYNSGDDITNKLFNLPGITYTILLTHPDYNKLSQLIFISSKDFEKENSFRMESKQAFNMIYVDISAGNRMVLKNMLQEKIGNYQELNLPFLMVVSNGQKPRIIKSQSSFNEFISKIGIAMTQQPSSKEDRDAIINNLPLDSLAKVSNIQFQYFLSTDTYASSSDGLINDLLKDLKLYFKTKPDVYIYINYDIPDDRKNTDYLYHTIPN